MRTFLGTVTKKDKSGNYARFTLHICPCCFKQYESQRKSGIADVTKISQRQRRHCGAEKCKKQWQAFARCWTNKYGKYENWPPLPKTGANKKEYVRKCQTPNCESEFIITRWPYSNGKPIERNDEKKYCTRKCASEGYYNNVTLKPRRKAQVLKYNRTQGKKDRENLGDNYIKARIQAEMKRTYGTFIPYYEISQEMIEDAKALLSLKRAFAYATGKHINAT